jgi:hypothetical protein
MLCSILADGFGEPTRARQRDAEGVEGLHRIARSRVPAPIRDEARLVAEAAASALGPGDRRRVVAGPKRQPAHLLEQVRALDRIAVGTQAIEARLEAGAGTLAVAGLPVQRADLAAQASRRDDITRRADLAPQRLVELERVGAPSRKSEQISEPLARGMRQVVAVGAVRERAQGALVVADRVVVGIDAARPVAGREQVACALGLVGREAPVMAERFEIAQPLRSSPGRVRSRARFARAACARGAAGSDGRPHGRGRG